MISKLKHIPTSLLEDIIFSKLLLSAFHFEKETFAKRQGRKIRRFYYINQMQSESFQLQLLNGRQFEIF